METNKTNPQHGAFACASDHLEQAGLTKREYFAAMAMQGLMAFDPMMYGRKVMAEYCVDMADALIRQLNIKDFNP